MSESIDELIQKLEDTNQSVRSKAAGALGTLGDSRAIESLIKALGDPYDWVRQHAVEPLIKALGDRSEHVRSEAAGALGKLDNARAVEPLIQALENINDWVRWNAARALGEIGSPDTLPRKILLCTGMSIPERVAALNALSAKGQYFSANQLHQYLTPDARRYCEKMVGDANAEVHEAAGAILHFLSGDTLLRPSQRNETGGELLRGAEPPVAPKRLKTPLWKRSFRA